MNATCVLASQNITLNVDPNEFQLFTYEKNRYWAPMIRKQSMEALYTLDDNDRRRCSIKSWEYS